MENWYQFWTGSVNNCALFISVYLLQFMGLQRLDTTERLFTFTPLQGKRFPAWGGMEAWERSKLSVGLDAMSQREDFT